MNEKIELWAFFHKMFKILFPCGLIGFFLSQNVLATETTFSGYLDGSYNYLSQSNQFVSGTNSRGNDLEPNGLTLQQAGMTLAYQPQQGWGGLLDVIGGRDVNNISSYGFNPLTEFDSQTLSFDLTQIYLQYAVNKFTFIGGRYTVLTGAESNDPTQDTNFSRSLLDVFAQPNTVTGVRMTYAVNDKINLIAGVNNGWDNIRDLSRRKTIELGISDTVNEKFSFSLQGYSGEERATANVDEGPIGTRNLIDLVATFNATKKLSFVANYDYGWQTRAFLSDGDLGEATWSGIAGYINYKLNDKWQTSLRGEIFDDRDGFRTGVSQCIKEVTLTLGYSPIKNFEIHVETRHDFSNVN
jgi:hypothetical protein